MKELKSYTSLLSKAFVILNSFISVAIVQAAPQTFEVVEQPVKQNILLEGIVEAKNRGTLAAQTSGRVVSINVDVNDYVKAGDIVLEISAKQQTAAVTSAQAQLNSAIAQDSEAQSQLARFNKLFPKGAISQDQMDSAKAKARSSKAAVKSAIAAVEQAKESLDYTSIRAPYDGIVIDRMVELGETVSPGTPLITGLSLSELRVTSEIPQRYQTKVESLTQFTIAVDQNQTINPVDYSLFSYADAQSHSFKIRLDLPLHTQGLYPGMWVKTRFDYGLRNVILIPESAVIKRGELSAVYREVGGERRMNPVRLGQLDDGFYEVLSGLEVGDSVFTHAVK